MGYVAYIPFCFIIVMLRAGSSGFGQFHARRGFTFTAATLIGMITAAILFIVFGVFCKSYIAIPKILCGVALLVWTAAFAYFTLTSQNVKIKQQ